VVIDKKASVHAVCAKAIADGLETKVRNEPLELVVIDQSLRKNYVWKFVALRRIKSLHGFHYARRGHIDG
jgi:hypothetical protein